ncbi:hypothetical protein CDA63_05790 [Hymenobacter amundsenii]|uniref:Lipoprotein n=1 Tax=Hymenobacter amundsenii TaxID=2006685 RepID=A0A246FMK2_9BACT|nr:hypothetical protein [Hymenobacter amundsenii]OWP63977.1 hypothetical protein CDA63_05790 [Hymenobacter amundsenii]
MRYATPLLRLSLLSTLALAACSKFNSTPTEKLPSPTTQGLNTAGCRGDGTVWLPLQQNLFAPEPIVSRVARTAASRPGIRLTLTLTRQPAVDGYANANTTIELYVPRLTTVGPVTLGQYVPRNVPSDHLLRPKNQQLKQWLF